MSGRTRRRGLINETIFFAQPEANYAPWLKQRVRHSAAIDKGSIRRTAIRELHAAVNNFDPCVLPRDLGIIDDKLILPCHPSRAQTASLDGKRLAGKATTQSNQTGRTTRVQGRATFQAQLNPVGIGCLALTTNRHTVLLRSQKCVSSDEPHFNKAKISSG
jgi:hypothetical protein